MSRTSVCTLFTAAIFLSACQGSPTASTAKESDTAHNSIPAATATVINVGDSLRLAGTCHSQLDTIKIYVGEQFLQAPSAVMINLIANNPDLGIDAMVAAVGEAKVDEATQSFQYVITHGGQEIAHLKLENVDGIPSKLTGKISIEGFDATCE